MRLSLPCGPELVDVGLYLVLLVSVVKFGNEVVRGGAKLPPIQQFRMQSLFERAEAPTAFADLKNGWFGRAFLNR